MYLADFSPSPDPRIQNLGYFIGKNLRANPNLPDLPMDVYNTPALHDTKNQPNLKPRGGYDKFSATPEQITLIRQKRGITMPLHIFNAFAYQNVALKSGQVYKIYDVAYNSDGLFLKLFFNGAGYGWAHFVFDWTWVSDLTAPVWDWIKSGQAGPVTEAVAAPTEKEIQQAQESGQLPPGFNVSSITGSTFLNPSGQPGVQAEPGGLFSNPIMIAGLGLLALGLLKK